MKVANKTSILDRKCKTYNPNLLYSAPPPCQVEEQEYEKGKGKVRFKVRPTIRTVPIEPRSNKEVCKWAKRVDKKKERRAIKQQSTIDKTTKSGTKEEQTPIEGYDDLVSNCEAEIAEINALCHATDRLVDRMNARYDKIEEDRIKKGVLDGSTPSAVADSGATSSCGQEDDPLVTTGQASQKIFIQPDGTTMQATEAKKLQQQVREPARTIDIVPGLAKNSLLSTGKFADANYVTIFDKDEVNIYDANDTIVTVSRGAILRGWRDHSTGLWRVPLVDKVCNINTDTVMCNKPPTMFLQNCPKPDEAVFNVYELRTTKEKIRFYHAAAGFPTKLTWIRAIKNKHYVLWPGLTVNAVNKHFPESEETQKGHMRKIKAGIRSTKVKVTAEEDMEPPDSATKAKQQDIFVKVYDLEGHLAEMIYTDQTGKFPTRSSLGNQYIMVLAEVDSNSILVEPLRNRTAGEMVKTYQRLIDRLKGCGIQPKRHMLDNECSAEMKEAIKSNKMTYQLTPANDHRRNLAEKAIQTFKDHFIAILCGTDENFPMHLWDRLLPQAEMTLNLLRQSRTTPNLLAYAHLNGEHNYNEQPLAPLGCAVEMHVTPDNRESWAPHSLSGFYVGTSDEHYRCHKIWVKDTRNVRVAHTVFFKHKYLTMPTLTNADALLNAAKDMKDAIQGSIPQSMQTKEAIEQLMDIFKQNAEIQKEASKKLRNALREKVQRQRVWNETPIENMPKDAPARNTRSQKSTRTLQQEMLLSMMDISGPRTHFTPKQAAARKFPLQFLCEFAGAVLDGKTGELLEYCHLMKRDEYRPIWGKSFGNEIGRLAQGMPGRVEGTNTIFFINKDQIPQDRWKDVTYARICCDYREQKEEKERTRITVGGDKINYPDHCGTPTADLLTVKLLFNSIISTPGAKFMSLDIKNFYLMTPLKRYEYVRMKYEDFPEDVIEHYNLKEKVVDGYIYVECRRGMYGLPQGGLLAQELLEERLEKHGYRQSKLTPGLWKHDTFTLVVDDFGVKYEREEDIQHLIEVLQENYEISIDREGSKYLGLSIDWDYKNREVHLSMPGYVEKALKRFVHKEPTRCEDQPHQHTIPAYGSKVQYAQAEDTTRPLTKQEKQFVQQVCGTFLYYARAVDGTMLVALSAIASQQANPTADTLKKTKKFLDYAASHPDAVLTYKRSDMILAAHSDASYLSEREARSRAGGHFYMSDRSRFPPNNGAVLNTAQIIKAVMSSAAEAELGALYINAQKAVSMRITLEEMGHKQPPTPMQTDNTTALGVVTNNIQPQRNSTGSETEKTRSNSDGFGAQDRQIWPIILPNITAQPITKP